MFFLPLPFVRNLKSGIDCTAASPVVRKYEIDIIFPGQTKSHFRSQTLLWFSHTRKEGKILIIVRKDLKAQRTAAGAAGGWIACLPSVRSWEMTKRKSFIFFLQKFSGNGGTPFRLEKGKKSFLVLSPVLNRNICRKKSPFGDTLYVRRAISPHLLSHFRKRKSVVSETIKISFLTARIFSVPIPPPKKKSNPGHPVRTHLLLPIFRHARDSFYR